MKLILVLLIFFNVAMAQTDDDKGCIFTVVNPPIDDTQAQNTCFAVNTMTDNKQIEETKIKDDFVNGKVEDALNDYKKSTEKEIEDIDKKINNNNDYYTKKVKDFEDKKSSYIKQKNDLIKARQKSINEKEKLIKKIENNPRSKGAVNNYKKSINKLNADIEKYNNEIKAKELETEDNDPKLKKLKKQRDEKNAVLESQRNNLVQVVGNIETKGRKIAEETVNKECKGIFKQAKFSEAKVVLPGQMTYGEQESKTVENISWKEIDINGNEVEKSIPFNQVLGMFDKLEDANHFIHEQYQTKPNITQCNVQNAPVSEIVNYPNSVTRKDQNLTKISHAGESFPDNGMSLNTQNDNAKKSWNDSTQKWKDELKDYSLEGKTVDKKLRGVKIYTCASMVSNCVPGQERNDYENSCGILDFVRTSFTDKNFDIDNLIAISEKIKKGETLTQPQQKLYNQINLKADEKKMLLRLFEKESPFIKTMNKLADDNPQYDSKIYSKLKTKGEALSSIQAEQLSFLALSSLRGLNMFDEFKASLGEEELKTLDPKKIEIIPTGEPDSMMSNVGLNPMLAGTCGPLPPYGSVYGQCKPIKTKADKNMELESCNYNDPENEMTYDPANGIKPLCKKVRDHYDQQYVKDELARQFENSYLGKKDNLTTQEKYTFFRYYRIQPVIDETITEDLQKAVEKDRYFVTCKGLKFSCKDTTPTIEFKGSFTFGNSGGTSGGGGGGGCTTCCPAWD